MVRSKLERLLIRDGEHMLTRDVLRKEEEGEVYWNLVWYCARFGLPVPLAQTSGEAPGSLPNFLKEITVVGLNERTVHERLSNRLLSAVEYYTDGGTRGGEGESVRGAKRRAVRAVLREVDVHGRYFRT